MFKRFFVSFLTILFISFLSNCGSIDLKKIAQDTTKGRIIINGEFIDPPYNFSSLGGVAKLNNKPIYPDGKPLDSAGYQNLKASIDQKMKSENLVILTRKGSTGTSGLHKLEKIKAILAKEITREEKEKDLAKIFVMKDAIKEILDNN